MPASTMTAPSAARTLIRCLAWALASTLVLAACSSGVDRSAAVRADSADSAASAATVTLMDFAQPMSLDPLPAGWAHRTFWTHPPMQMSFGRKDGVAAIRLATKASASMLMRAVDIDLQAFPLLAWRWYIEQPIASTVDERTHAGDDHPARLFLTFHTAGGEKRSMEIVWGNKLLHAGDYKFIDGFPHYVANGGDANIGRWWSEQIDLLAIYKKLWPDAAPARLTDIGLFCDSDETGGASIAWFADVRMKRVP